MCRDGRLRNYLSSRYDNRLGVFDWDYYMKLQEMVSAGVTVAAIAGC